MLLSYHIFIQTCLDLMGRGNVPYVQNRLLIGLLFLLQLLLVGDPPVPLQIRKVHEADIGKPVLLGHLLQIVLKLGIVQHPLIVKLADGLHRLVHTVAADTDIVWKLEHLPRLALRPAADKAYVLVFAVVALPRILGGRSVGMPLALSRGVLCQILLGTGAVLPSAAYRIIIPIVRLFFFCFLFFRIIHQIRHFSSFPHIPASVSLRTYYHPNISILEKVYFHK